MEIVHVSAAYPFYALLHALNAKLDAPEAGDEDGESEVHLPYDGNVPDDHGRVRNKLTRAAYFELMASWLQRNYDQTQNIIVIAPTTPAQYFHALRRQIHRHYAKPLVVMSAKWLLHHKSCTSDMIDMGPGTFFQRVILEEGRGDNMSTRRTKTNLMLCSHRLHHHGRVIFKMNLQRILNPCVCSLPESFDRARKATLA